MRMSLNVACFCCLSEGECTVKLSIGGKLKGKKCPFCGEENVYFTRYIGHAWPNVECRSCGEQWVESPETKLHIARGCIGIGTNQNGKCLITVE